MCFFLRLHKTDVHYNLYMCGCTRGIARVASPDRVVDHIFITFANIIIFFFALVGSCLMVLLQRLDLLTFSLSDKGAGYEYKQEFNAAELHENLCM